MSETNNQSMETKEKTKNTEHLELNNEELLRKKSMEHLELENEDSLKLKNKKPLKAKNNELLKPKNDFVFQSLFNKGNEKITKAFISALLGEQINKITINEDKELYREYSDDKLGILDLQVNVNDEEKVDVEVQIVDRSNLPERLILYLSKMFSEQIKRGGLYEDAKKVILIAIIDYEFELTKEIKEFETQWKLRETKKPQKILTDKVEICIIELRKLRENYLKNKENKKLQWLLFLDNPNSEEVKEIMEDSKVNVRERHE